MTEHTQIPRTGMLATVRNRRGLITAVHPFGNDANRLLHLVTVEYTEADGEPEEQLLWECEPGARVVEPKALPDPARDAPMPNDEFDALVRASRWTALSPFVDPGGEGPLQRLPIAAPLHGAIQVEDFQLVPLLKALRMPRISLLIADDVGLGKTVEAGLILQELIIRRRIRRVLILSPASLRSQWRDELRDKFALMFDIVDRDSTYNLRKQLGLDANPWRMFPRVITSYHYLRQPDVLEEFWSASKPDSQAAQLPWDLLVVDEVHNLSPAPFGEDSDLARMLARIAPLFEHRIFLSATPHNGHTRSFSGLLETLDPVRFSRAGRFSPAERQRIEDVLVRRLKREINERTSPARFASRDLRALPIRLSLEESRLSEAFSAFRSKVRSLVARSRRSEQLAGSFAVEILGKRLLSCPVAFADSWHRYLQGISADEATDVNDVTAAKRAVEEDTGDDRENESRTGHAARTVGAWLTPLAPGLKEEMRQINEALAALGLDAAGVPPQDREPRSDARVDALAAWIEEHLRAKAGAFRDDERAVIFTEYKTTLDYLEAQLKRRYPESGAIRVLYGGLPGDEREDIKTAFNDPADPVRILLATDAASEGLNLQETARLVVHCDVPWNPSRLEQRNGRLDRHGQARNVYIHHFSTDDDADLAFLAYVVGKVNSVREDLGSTGEVFDLAFQRRLIEGEAVDRVRADLDRQVREVRERTDVPRDATVRSGVDGEEELARLVALQEELDINPEALRTTLDIALGIGVDRPRIERAEGGRYRLKPPIPGPWRSIIDDTLRLHRHGRSVPGDGGAREPAALRSPSLGALSAVVFDPAFFLQKKGDRLVFRASRDTLLLHLAHPVYQRALSVFARARFPGSESSSTRWTVRRGRVPAGCEALLFVTVEEMAANELRESFHHWIRTLRFPVKDGELGEPLPHEPAARHCAPVRPIEKADVEQAREIWDEVRQSTTKAIKSYAMRINKELIAALAREREKANARERERFQSRQGELSALVEQQRRKSREQRLTEIETELRQGLLFADERYMAGLLESKRELELELDRNDRHYEELRQQLERERDRILKQIVPGRFTMRGEVQVLPVAVEIRLPEVAR